MARSKAIREGQLGFTYIAMLAALMIFGIGLAALGETWSAVSRRAKEEELLQIGATYASAIARFHKSSPGSNKTYPQSLQVLLEDTRFVGTMRHLRRLYRDPITNQAEWGLIRAPDGGIAGVYSKSEKPTLRAQPFLLADGVVVNGVRYSDWKFVFRAGE